MAMHRAPRRVDAHHHLWRYSTEEYGWIDDSMASLRRDFLLNDLCTELQSAGVKQAVAVQARQSLEETRWLLSLARQAVADSPIVGVVGWLPLASPELPELVERFQAEPALRGVRHVVQGEPSGFLDRDDFNRGVRSLLGTGWTYDVLIFSHQLEQATRFVDRHSQQVFVLDHIAKPAIREGEFEPWAARLRELARRPNVSCKISGMVTEADPAMWSAAQLRPYFDVVLEAFGPERLMVGSDWPVLTVRCGYAEWWSIVEQWIAPLAPDEQASILGENAARVYGLPGPEAHKENE